MYFVPLKGFYDARVSTINAITRIFEFPLELVVIRRPNAS
jgi:hypothetical protein